MSSSIAVAADSTQSEQHHDRRRKKTASERKHKRKGADGKKGKKGQRTEQKKATKRKQTNRESSDNDSDLDFSKELKPIVGYLDDRAVMVDHMYRSISGTKLRAMLPEIMKPLSAAELRLLCLEQLEVMSKKRIRRILEGDNADNISSSGTEDSGDEDRENKEETPLDGEREGGVADSTNQPSWELREWADEGNEPMGSPTEHPGENHESSEIAETQESPVETFQEERTDGYSSGDHSPILTLEVQDRSLYDELEDGELPSDEHDTRAVRCHSEEPPAHDETTATETKPPKVDRETAVAPKEVEEEGDKKCAAKTSGGISNTQREILELEMRARAIKAMLKAHEERKRRVALESKLLHTQSQ